tara:strand:+ start:38 stop:310 length:273 start_codon:yes stop_codon:yes gene_type:complete
MTDICITQDPEFYSHLYGDEIKKEVANFELAVKIFDRASDSLFARFCGVKPTEKQIKFICRCVDVFHERGEHHFAHSLDERLTEWCEVSA